MIIKDIFQSHGFNNITAFSGSDISDDLIKRCLNLDKVFYEDEFLFGSFDITQTIKQNSQMCFILLDDEKQTIVGYTYWLPVKDNILTQYMDNKKILLEVLPEYCTGFKTSPINLFNIGEAFVPGYDLLTLHKALEDLFQYHILCLAQMNIKISTICFDAVNKYDEKYLVARTGLRYYEQKENCKFYFDSYDPRRVFKESPYSQELMNYYN